jgi:tetratricopeptide (TPR) repeat protein
MPSHTWFLVGRYQEAAQANAAALAADRAYAEATDFPTPLGRKTYHAHDVQFGLGAALISGDRALALQFVRQFNADFPSPEGYEPWVVMTAAHAYAALGRFAEPEQALAATAAPQPRPLLEAMRHYARAEAELRLARVADAQAEAAQIKPFDGAAGVTPATVVRIARLTLTGDLAMAAHDPAAAAGAFRQAAALQDKLAREVDPPAWWYPVRRSLAAALLAQGDAAAAEREADLVLRSWPADPVTLAVKAKAQAARHGPDAAALAAQARAAWRGDPRELSIWFVG